MSGDARAKAEAAFAHEGLDARTWSNQPGHIFAEHSHEFHKVLFCIAGSIIFHTLNGDVYLEAGDRLDLPPGTPHSATVGSKGVTCLEGARPIPRP